VFKLTNPRVITATCGSIILEGITYLLPKVILNAPHGSIQLLARRNVDQYSRSETESSAVWTSVTQDSALNVTHTPCQFSKDCIIETHTAESVLVEAVQGKTIEWIRRIELNGGTLTQRDLIDLHLSEHFEAEGPTAALGLVVALAVTIATSGAGASLGATVAGVQAGVTATTAQAFVIGATQAAFTTVCSQAANAILTHQGNVGKATQALVSSDFLKSIAIAAGSAGLGRTIGSVPTRIAIGLARGDRPQSIMTGIVVDRVSQSVTRFIGEAKLDAVTHKLAHAAVGAATGAVLSQDRQLGALSGAVGAAVAETLADVMKDQSQELRSRALAEADKLGLEPSRENLTGIISKDLEATINVAHLGGAVAALLIGLDPGIASHTATTALYNNFALSTVSQALEGYAEGVADSIDEDLRGNSGSDTDDGAEESGVGRVRRAYADPVTRAAQSAARTVGLDRVAEATDEQRKDLSGGSERYARRKLHRLESMIGELPADKRDALQAQYEEYYAEDRLALDLMKTVGSVAGALASLPGKAVDGFLRHTGLTDKYNARAAGHMVTDALGLAGAATAAKGIAKTTMRGVRLAVDSRAVGPRPASSAATQPLLRTQLIAEQIAKGHALEKHVVSQGEFPGWIRKENS
jgi:hypothetical protein